MPTQNADHISIPTITTSKRRKENYSYTSTLADLQMEQQAFQAGEGVRNHLLVCMHAYICVHRNVSLLMDLYMGKCWRGEILANARLPIFWMG